MLRRTWGITAIVLFGVLLVSVVAAWALPNTAEAGRGDRQGGGRGWRWEPPVTSVPVVDEMTLSELSESEAEALRMALNDEYKAWSVYGQVINDFGAVRPFTNIQKAEQQHIDALVTLFHRYGVDVPANEWPGTVPTFGTRAEACAAGVQAEIDNAALYDKLFGMVDNPDIIQVFTSLQQASETKHLPAFQRCAR
jgi:hypothetical protein